MKAFRKRMAFFLLALLASVLAFAQETPVHPGKIQALQGLIHELIEALNQSPSMDAETKASLLELNHALRSQFEKDSNEHEDLHLEEAFYLEKVKPILEERCLHCHGPALSMSGLDLSNRDSLMKGGERGLSAIPGNAGESPLYELITHQREPFMPHGEDRMSDEEIEIVREWIDNGAAYAAAETRAEGKPSERPIAQSGAISTGIPKYEIRQAQRDFWSFQPLKEVAVPIVKNAEWARNPIDAFIKSKLEQENLSPSPPAEKRALLRRVYFDLIGLPPSVEAVDAFLDNASENAYETIVDELLASPRFGERWARHWLDVARYADSGGYEFDVERPNAYPYRDFVIKAFNQDLPFQDFIRWQIAGDEYAPDNPLALAATGFCASGPTISNQANELNRYDELDDMVSTTGQAMLGLTLACARCHDHKYDPIPQYDYYRMAAFFTSTKRDVRHLAPQDAIESYERIRKNHQDDLNAAQNELREFRQSHANPIRIARIDALPITLEEKVLLKLPVYNDVKEQKELLDRFEKELRIDDKCLMDALDEHEQKTFRHLKKRAALLKENKPEELPKGLTLTDRGSTPALSYFLERGDPNNKRALVEPGFLQALATPELERDAPWFQPKPPKATTTHRRTALAEWLTDAKQGAGALTARVYVNRLWQHTMGQGLVKTPNNFGFQGERPTHPELLEWLASELLRSQGSSKHIIRLIATSAAYRQSALQEPSANLDPNNQLYARRKLKRIEAEIQRDAMLAISGRLNDEMYGPGIQPWMHPDAIATGSTGKWPADVVDGPETWRRSVYMFIRRSTLHPLMQLFDAPDATGSCARRIETVVPTQALTLLNDSFVRDQSRHFSKRIMEHDGGGISGWIKNAYQIALSRTPTARETADSLRFIQEQRLLYQNNLNHEDDHRDARLEHAMTDFCQAIFNLNEFVYID